MLTYERECARASSRTRRIALSPAEKHAASAIEKSLPNLDVIVLKAEAGKGKTSVLQALERSLGGALLSVDRFIDLLRVGHPAMIEETVFEMISEALSKHDLVLIDDLDLIVDVAGSCDYPRQNLLNAAFKAVLERLEQSGKKLIAATAGALPDALETRAVCFEIRDFTAADYECICRAYLPASADHVDFAAVHRFAPKLNGHQLKNASLSLAGERAADTEALIGVLRARNMVSNVEIEEVAAVDWKDLKGVEDVIRALETKIAFPFEQGRLAKELALKPKRGVLLAGPPGTGKTTIGRALAHRLKGKFFLIDGTMIAGSRNFHPQVDEVFEAAQKNAPSVIFIDDADVIFEDNKETGFYRYLLTKLDGLHSASSQRVCVMLTAMDVSSLPAALVRSGRIELWLETRLPDAAAREEIFREGLAGLPEPFPRADLRRLALASQGLTGADLKAVIEDGKLLFAHDRASGSALRSVDEYLIEAIETVKSNRQNYGKKRLRSTGGVVRFGFQMTEDGRTPGDITPGA